MIAINQAYKNFVNIKYENNLNYNLNYFFYGKKIKKNNFFYKLNQKRKTFIIFDKNLFRTIINFSNKKLLNLSKKNIYITKKYLTSLNQIKKHIKL
jgi:hypothetical protein